MNQKDKFLQDVTKDIKYIFARNKIRKELENHILEGLDAGFSEDEVICDMGNPKKISNEFNQVYNHTHFFYFFLKVIFLILVIYISIHATSFIRRYKVLKETPFMQDANRETAFEQIDKIIPLDNEHELNNIVYEFKNLYKLKDKWLVIEYEYHKIDPFAISESTYFLRDCNEYTCFKTDDIPFEVSSSKLVDMGKFKGLLVIESNHIPDTISMRYMNVFTGNTQEFKIKVGD